MNRCEFKRFERLNRWRAEQQRGNRTEDAPLDFRSPQS